MNLNPSPHSFYPLFFGDFPAHLSSFQPTVVFSSSVFTISSPPLPPLPLSQFFCHFSWRMLVRCVHSFSDVAP